MQGLILGGFFNPPITVGSWVLCPCSIRGLQNTKTPKSLQKSAELGTRPPPMHLPAMGWMNGWMDVAEVMKKATGKEKREKKLDRWVGTGTDTQSDRYTVRSINRGRSHPKWVTKIQEGAGARRACWISQLQLHRSHPGDGGGIAAACRLSRGLCPPRVRCPKPQPCWAPMAMSH